MKQLLLIIVTLSNLLGGIAAATDFAAASDHPLSQSHQQNHHDTEHDDDAHSHHCGHVAGHFLGIASHEPALLLERASPQFETPINRYRSEISQPAVPPNI